MADLAGATLIVIDMQNCMGDPTCPPRNNREAEDNIARLLQAWRTRNWPCIHIKHNSTDPTSGFRPHQIGNHFQARFIPAHGARVVEKNVTDAFSGTDLLSILQKEGAQELILVGVSTNNSVEATARHAGCLGFEVIVVEDACFTFDRTDITGTMRAAHDIHIASLSNIAGEYGRVLSTDAVVRLSGV